MFSGEAEIQARRRTLTVLQDEVRSVLDSARDLAQAFDALVNNDPEALQASIAKIKKSEDDVESLRRTLTRELADIGTLIINREDLLRAAYDVEEIAGYITGIAFRFKQITPNVLKKNKLDVACKDLIDKSIEAVRCLNQVVLALSLKPISAIDTAYQLQTIEKEIDENYRELIARIFNEVQSIKDLIILKDIVERIENISDRCLAASDSITIVALGF